MAAEMAGMRAPEAAAGEVRLSRVFAAPLHVVWQAWTEPGRVARWWGPAGFTTPVCALDVRPGGEIRIDMRAPNGVVHSMTGTYREVDPLRRLVFVSAALGGDGAPLFEMETTVTFAGAGGQTTVSVHARVLHATPAAAPHLGGAQVGWSQQMDRLADYVGGAAEAGGPAGTGFLMTRRSEREVVMTRTFDAPAWLVFLAWTTPERFARWWGPHGFRNTVQAMDVRPGGAWRVMQEAPGGAVHPFRGVYREVVPAERLVFTQVYDVAPWADHELVVTATFAEHGGRTALTLTMRAETGAEMDAALGSGMESGAGQSLERLASDLAAAAVGPETPWAGEIVATRVLAAPRALVWRMWTAPEHVARWWGPRGFRTTIAGMDVRPGGTWRFVMHGPDGTDYDNEMVFAEVVEPERLVYTHTVPPRFRQEVTFAEVEGGRTRVTVRNVFERAEDVQPYAVAGLGETLERLEAAVRERVG